MPTTSGQLKALLILLAAASTVASAQTPWPDFMQRLSTASSSSPVAAVIQANATVVPPAADVPPSKAKWSGRWSGWACNRWICDTKLVVEQVTAEEATIVYAFASANVQPSATRLKARFVDDELQATFGNGAKVAYRMRLDGSIEHLWYKGDSFAAGILTKDQ